MLCPHDLSIFRGFGFLQLLLPICSYKTKVTDGNYQTSDYSWLEEYMAFANLMSNTTWDSTHLRFLSRLAHYAPLDWERYIPDLFTK